MNTLIIPDFDEAMEAQLRARAARRGHSVEDEIAAILRDALIAADSPFGTADDNGASVRSP